MNVLHGDVRVCGGTGWSLCMASCRFLSESWIAEGGLGVRERTSLGRWRVMTSRSSAEECQKSAKILYGGRSYADVPAVLERLDRLVRP